MARLRSRPRSRVGASARQGPSRPSVGRRRRRSSPLSSAGGLLFRLETAGITLLVLALIAVPWLIPATRGVTDLRDGFVRTFGLLVFAFIALIALLGLALIRRRLDSVFASWKPWLIVALSATFVSGLLGFFRPGWQLGDVLLDEVTAGGDLGHLMAGHPVGIIVWLAAGIAAFAVISPTGAATALHGIDVAARTAWGWRVPQRTWGSARALMNLVFPTRPPAEGAPKVPLDSVIGAQHADADAEEIDQAVAESPAASAEEAPPSDIGEQAPLPMNGDAPDELETVSGDEPRKAQDGWQLPPLDVLVDVNPQEGQPDNSARGHLIVETLASFGVDAPQ